jgi:hypothetical protein
MQLKPTSKGVNPMVFVKADMVSNAPIEHLLLCPLCKIEMRLFGIEAESKKSDLYTFECVTCGGLQVKSIQTP